MSPTPISHARTMQRMRDKLPKPEPLVPAPCSSVFIVRCNGYENQTIFSAWMSKVNAEQEAARLNTASRAVPEDEHHVVVEEVALDRPNFD